MTKLNISSIVIEGGNVKLLDTNGELLENICGVQISMNAGDLPSISIVAYLQDVKITGLETVEYNSTLEKPITIIKERPLDYEELQDQATKQGYMLVPNDHDETESVPVEQDLQLDADQDSRLPSSL